MSFIQIIVYIVQSWVQCKKKKKKKKKDKRSIHSIPPQGDDSTKYERPERSDR